MSLRKLTDQELINLYLEGHSNAFEFLLLRHKDKLFTSIYLFVKDTEMAEDIFQDVCIKIVDTLKKNKYNNEGKFLQWAMRIAYNLCVDHFRKSKKFCKVNPTETFDIFSVVSSNEDHMESMMIKDQTSSQIRQLIDMLPEEQREVIILRHYADMSFKEIAMMTRVSINTALGRMRYALINLRKYAKERQIALSES